MKSFIVVSFVVASLAIANAALTEEQKQKVIENGKACVTETGVDSELVQKARQGSFTDDPKLKAFALCMSKKTGFQNDVGEIQTEVVKQKLTDALDDADAANKVIEKCLVAKGSKEETAFESFRCYYENTPTHLSVF